MAWCRESIRWRDGDTKGRVPGAKLAEALPRSARDEHRGPALLIAGLATRFLSAIELFVGTIVAASGTELKVLWLDA
jgi:hypothetical protein